MAGNYMRLRGRLRERGITQARFASMLGVCPTSLSLKLSGKREWTRREIERSCEILEIPLSEAYIFFLAN